MGFSRVSLEESIMNRQHATVLAALGLALCIPAQADPPPWAPAHGYRAKQERVYQQEYRYMYYPAQQVYYAPQQGLWFWMNGGNWQFGVNLPTQYRVSSSSGVQVMLHSERPYVEHVYVEEHYGRPWREKHGHRENHKEKHHKHHHDD
jgi:hypothetical protein